ncbi:MAG: ubiquinone/menaquinone biosynthesis C-methylase UbiE [Paraglaciecola sp.]|jgi:ubiquinone/menaquinone biosynthesis C-methylase UbiE
MSDNNAIGQSWDIYWQGTYNASAHKDGGPQDVALELFWSELLSDLAYKQEDIRMLDVACGNGAVTGFALNVASQKNINLYSHCTDYSLSAVQSVQKKYPSVKGVSSDAKHLPFQSGSFDAVVSQFGIEYAGSDAFGECAELVSPSGIFAAIVHLTDGAIYKECQESLEASQKISEIRILELARDAFKAAYDVLEGRAEQEIFVQADKSFSPAVNEMKSILLKKGEDVAGGTVYGLFNDLGHMYSDIGAYNPKDVFEWIDKMVLELEAYSARMSSMLDAAIGVLELQKVIDLVTSKGMSVTRKGQLSFTEGKPAAWILVCKKAAIK